MRALHSVVDARESIGTVEPEESDGDTVALLMLDD